MIATSCLLAAVLELALVIWLMSEAQFLIPYRVVLVTVYGRVFLTLAAVLFVDLFGVIYLITRKLFLKDTGRKLDHLSRYSPWRKD